MPTTSMFWEPVDDGESRYIAATACGPEARWKSLKMNRSVRFDVAPHVIDDYAEASGATRTRAGMLNGQQPGDPAKLAAAVVKLVDSDTPPVRLPLGAPGY
jgi:hypothetical protein